MPPRQNHHTSLLKPSAIQVFLRNPLSLERERERSGASVGKFNPLHVAGEFIFVEFHLYFIFLRMYH